MSYVSVRISNHICLCKYGACLCKYGACSYGLRVFSCSIKLLNVNVKDGAYYCYCTYVLRISRYSDFLSPMLTNTGIFLRGLKLSGESRS